MEAGDFVAEVSSRCRVGCSAEQRSGEQLLLTASPPVHPPIDGNVSSDLNGARILLQLLGEGVGMK